MVSEEVDAWSATENDIRESLRGLGTAATVATVAAVDGSAYRRPGAKMLVTADGVATGAVTAGCLEPSVVETCDSVRRSGQPRTERFDLTDGGETWGLGLGCNGVIDVLVEPRDRSWDAVLDVVDDEEAIAVVTVVASDRDTAVGERVVVGESGVRAVPDRDPVPLPHLSRVRDTIARVVGTDQTRTVSVGDATLLVDGLAPIPELLLFGSQNDLGPVVRLGTRAGFRVSVHSPRGGVDASAFPEADAVYTGHPSTVTESVGGHTYAVVMSHNLLDDRIAVETLLRETAVPYVGVMGPRERFDRLRDELASDGRALTADELDRLAAPVGLDLGGGTPVDIALSIVSEVVAVRNGRDGGRLRDRSGPIHALENGR